MGDETDVPDGRESAECPLLKLNLRVIKSSKLSSGGLSASSDVKL